MFSLRPLAVLSLLGSMTMLICCAIKKPLSESSPVSHALWDSLLQQHVSDDGWVHYEGFQNDSIRLDAYLNLLSSSHPNDRHWSRDEQLAYWINAYNAYTIKIVSDHYPVKGIKEIKKGIPFVNTVWDIKFIKIENQLYDLNNIEHGIIRKQFDEPRIHFAVNCASVSCPALHNRAYQADQLTSQLEQAARRFINDPLRNQTDQTPARLSKIFTWFRGDFTRQMPLIEYINQYADHHLTKDAEIEFLDYDWNLNQRGAIP